MTTEYAILFWAVAALYALAAAGQVHGEIFAGNRWSRRAIHLLYAGLAGHTVLIAWRWLLTSHVPTIGTFENTLAGSWFVAATTVWAGRGRNHPLLAAVTLPFALILLGVGGLSDSTPGPLVGALQSSWLIIHIFFAWLAYGAYTVACGASILYLVQSRPGRAVAQEALDRLEELSFRTTLFGFVMAVVMIAAGALWAKNLWGAYWSWDPVETWALISWLIYGLALHLRATRGWRGRRFAWLLVAAIIAVIISFWGVELLAEGTEHFLNIG